MGIDRLAGTGRSGARLTREDVEQLLSKVESSAQLNLSSRHMEDSNLSYLDLRGANLRGANFQGANLRGTNLSGAYLQAANLCGADLDGADMTGAHLGDVAAERANLRQARLSYATLKDLNLREFDLSDLDLHNADLNGSDLRDAVLHGTNLRGADLSTARLYGPELRRAILHGGALLSDRMSSERRARSATRPLPPHASSASARPPLSDQQAMRLGEQALSTEADPGEIQKLFPQGFTFTQARTLFDTWLTQSGTRYSEREIQALWIGFAHRLCTIYQQANAPD
ncbi:hypothetical protein KDH_21970 [Dictyobacter sp. S3.2.2.5]|uniref:Pentapeptide repeat-containing protein n=1 Tax=Dictyobacter halimunensis TaxID=3026934 RepID=A0ABQ6FS71_9CHLR|nr:hypothetical protein KDH_21970 [Dictyobacter sp. S3.2.2.5]